MWRRRLSSGLLGWLDLVLLLRLRFSVFLGCYSRMGVDAREQKVIGYC